jgi:hypothetical protein
MLPLPLEFANEPTMPAMHMAGREKCPVNVFCMYPDPNEPNIQLLGRNNHPDVPRGRYELTIQVYDQGSPVERTFVLDPHGNTADFIALH